MQKKMSLSKICCLVAAGLVIVSIFSMFGCAEHWDIVHAQNDPSLFKLAFGIGTEYRKVGFTTLFVFEVLAMCASVMVFLCAFNVLLGETAVGIFAIISSVFSLVVLILAFCSRQLIGVHYPLVYLDGIIGYGSILLGVTHTIAIGLNIFAIVSDRKGK